MAQVHTLIAYLLLENGAFPAITSAAATKRLRAREVKSEECVLQLNDRVLKGGSIYCLMDGIFVGVLVSIA